MTLRKIFAEISNKEIKEGLEATDVMAGAEWEFEFKKNDALEMEEGSPKIEHIFEKASGTTINFNPWYENNAEVPYNEWVLKRDTSLPELTGAELTNPPMPLQEFLKIVPRVFDAIGTVGKTTHKCGLHINLSIKHPEKINISKLLLLIDEDKVYKVFNKEARKGTGRPVKEFIQNIIRENIKVGSEELKRGKLIAPLEQELNKTFRNILTKQYGINTGKLQKGYVEFRYGGGANYHKKWNKIKNIIGMYVFVLKIAADKNYKQEEYLEKLSNMINHELTEQYSLIKDTKRWLKELKPFFQAFRAKLIKIERAGTNKIYFYMKTPGDLKNFVNDVGSGIGKITYDKDKDAYLLHINKLLNNSAEDIPYKQYLQIKPKADKFLKKITKRLKDMNLPNYTKYMYYPKSKEVVLDFPFESITNEQFEQLGLGTPYVIRALNTETAIFSLEGKKYE